MCNQERQLLMVGSPRTGKTSFLALLWLAIVSGKAPGLQIAHYHDDREYLNLIAGRLQRCEPAKHTETGEDRDLALSLLLGASEVPATLRVPDLSGETWLDAAVDRHWPDRVDELVLRSRGLLLFIHAQNLDAGATKGQVNELAKILEPQLGSEPGPPTTPPAAGASATSAPRKKHTPPTQVGVVDVLQLVCEQRGLRPARVSLVISAWDLVATQMTPADYVSRNLPLVDQYVQSSERWMRFCAFGLSAQGGDFDDSTERGTLVAGDPVDRALVRHGDGRKASVHDIALWALGQEF